MNRKRTLRKNSEGQTLYPFSMLKEGHNVELAYNHQFIICKEMEEGTRDWDDAAFEWYDRLSEVYGSATRSPVYWATWPEYKVLKDAADWAKMYRDRRCYSSEN